MKKIGILGGTFDPIHIGHMQMAQAAYRRLALDRVYVIPAGYPYFKGKITPYDMRCDMVRLAAEHMNALVRRDFDGYASFSGGGSDESQGDTVFELSLAESDESRPTYTYETLKKLHEEEPDAQLYFICGEDVFTSLHSWKCPDKVLSEATLAVFRRQYDSGQEACLDELKKLYKGAQAVFMEDRIKQISSTDVRGALSRGMDTGEMIIPEIAEYIRQKGLYTQ